MNRIAVQSRDIALVGYDPESSRLEVAFRGGGVYEYYKIPAEVHDAFLRADSLGIYFRDHIKDRYEYKKLH